MRKTTTIRITDDGRDKGKEYLIQEMPASQVEKWAIRAFLALSKSGVEVPDDVMEAGIAGLASFGVKGLAGLQFADAEVLLDEMMSCVSIKPDPNHPEVTRNLVESDIEELSTRIRLRAEVFKLHVNFSAPGSKSEPLSTDKAHPGSKTTSMFRAR